MNAAAEPALSALLRTDNGARSVTSTTVALPFGSAVLVDTPGLHQGPHGTVPHDDAVLQLTRAITRATQEVGGGRVQLVHVARRDTDVSNRRDHERLAALAAAVGAPPPALVITRCDDYACMRYGGQVLIEALQPHAAVACVAVGDACDGTGMRAEAVRMARERHPESRIALREALAL